MFEFVYEGEPVGKGRPRVYKGHAITPQKTKDYECKVRMSFLHVASGDLPIYDKGEPIELKLYFNFAVPKSYSKKKREHCIDGNIKHTKRPDVDNLIKAVMDAMNGYLFQDDSQVIKVIANKAYAAESSVKVIACSK